MAVWRIRMFLLGYDSHKNPCTVLFEIRIIINHRSTLTGIREISYLNCRSPIFLSYGTVFIIPNPIHILSDHNTVIWKLKSVILNKYRHQQYSPDIRLMLSWSFYFIGSSSNKSRKKFAQKLIEWLENVLLYAVLWIRIQIRIRKDPKLFAGSKSGSGSVTRGYGSGFGSDTGLKA
jgi:hypothetical protein